VESAWLLVEARHLLHGVLHREIEPNNEQVILAYDPGSKWSGVTVLSGGHVVLNGIVEAVTWDCLPDLYRDINETR
jgi:hypothetical protein